MSYINQFIKETQVKYATAFNDPLIVLSHLFFTNGNGYAIEDGNPVEIVNEKLIPISILYGNESTLEELIEEHSFKLINEQYQRLLPCKYGTKVHEKLDKNLWESSVTQYFKKRKLLMNIDENPIQYTMEYWLSILQNYEYFYILHLREGYNLAEKFNDKTDPELVKLAKVLLDVFFHVGENFDEYKIGKLNPFSPFRDIEELKPMITEDLTQIRKLKMKLDLLD